MFPVMRDQAARDGVSTNSETEDAGRTNSETGKESGNKPNSETGNRPKTAGNPATESTCAQGTLSHPTVKREQEEYPP